MSVSAGPRTRCPVDTSNWLPWRGQVTTPLSNSPSDRIARRGGSGRRRPRTGCPRGTRPAARRRCRMSPGGRSRAARRRRTGRRAAPAGPGGVRRRPAASQGGGQRPAVGHQVAARPLGRQPPVTVRQAEVAGHGASGHRPRISVEGVVGPGGVEVDDHHRRYLGRIGGVGAPGDQTVLVGHRLDRPDDLRVGRPQQEQGRRGHGRA